MAEIRINATGGVKLYDADDSHYAQIIAGTITSNVDLLTLNSSGITVLDGAIDFDIASHDTSNGLKLGGTLVTATAAELNIMDGVTTTAAEINLIDGGTSRGTTALADGDGILINDGGTMRMTNVTTVKTYMGGAAADDISEGDGAVSISTTSGNITIDNAASDADIIFKGTDGGSDITALTLDMSADGHATFKNGITLSDGNVTVASGHGIDFSAQSDGTSMTSELLEDYEEGTWTPTFYDAESGGNQLSTSSAGGNYVKVGNLIRINSRSVVDSISGATGGNELRMRGLPYAIFNQAGNDAVGKAEIWLTATAIDSEITTLPSDAGAVAMFKYRPSADTVRPPVITVTILGATGSIISSLTYRTA